MKVEVLYFKGCPNHEAAVEQVRKALRSEGLPILVNEVEIIDPAMAQRVGFLGSPSIRIDGIDVEQTSSSGFLAVGGVAAVLVSSCCLGPLILVTMGFSGAWIGSLSALEPYRPLFLGLTLSALLMAGFRIFRRAKNCDVNGICSTPRTRRAQKFIFSVVALLAVVAFAFPYLAHFFY